MRLRLVLVLVFIVALAAPAAAQDKLLVRLDEQGNQIMWRMLRDGRALWDAHDLSARGTPDLLFFYDNNGETYSRIYLDVTGNGLADVVMLLDGAQNAKTFYDCDGDGRYSVDCPGGLGKMTEDFLDVVVRVNLRMALERRIEADRHPAHFWQDIEPDPSRGRTGAGPIAVGKGARHTLSAEISWTPAAIAGGTDPKARPLTVNAKKIVMVEGVPAGTAFRDLAVSTSLPTDPNSKLTASLNFTTFALPTGTKDDAFAEQWTVAFEGRLVLPGVFEGDFAFLAEISPDRPAFISTTAKNPAGQSRDLLFFIISLERGGAN